MPEALPLIPLLEVGEVVEVCLVLVRCELRATPSLLGLGLQRLAERRRVLLGVGVLRRVLLRLDVLRMVLLRLRRVLLRRVLLRVSGCRRLVFVELC